MVPLNFCKIMEGIIFNDCPILRRFWAKLARAPLQTNIDSGPGLDTGGRGHTHIVHFYLAVLQEAMFLSNMIYETGSLHSGREFHEFDSGWEETCLCNTCPVSTVDTANMWQLQTVLLFNSLFLALVMSSFSQGIRQRSSEELCSKRANDKRS